MSEIITRERLMSYVNYDPETGAFTHAIPRKSSRGVGMPCGTVQGRGYLSIRVEKRTYLAHRLAWLWVHGTFPPETIDHRNGHKLDNRIANLRLAKPWQNSANTKRPSHNTSGYKGVVWYKARGQWTSEIRSAGRKYFLGYFADKEAAAAAYAEAAHRLNGEFAKVA